MSPIKLAIFSPNENAYSETFIQAHRQLPFAISYYYQGWLPTRLDPQGSIVQFSLAERIKKKFTAGFSLQEHALLNSLRREGVNCVLAEYGPTGCAVLNVVKQLQLPLLVHFHGFDAGVKATIAEYGAQYKELFAYASAVFAVSGKMYNDLLQLGCPADKLQLATYGPHPRFLQLQPQYTNPWFVATGRFVEKKAPQLTLAAFQQVVAKRPDARLFMIGNGDLLNPCKALVKAWKLEEHVQFKGVQTAEEISQLFEQSLAFVQHSITAESGDTEGTPVAILEAQAAALPVAATRHAGIPDVVLHNQTGLLVDEFDVDGMASAMLQLLEQPALAAQMGATARQRISEHFTLEKHLGIIATQVQKAVSSNR